MFFSTASADNLTTADDDFPEYPMIKRTGTHGLPPSTKKPMASGRGTDVERGP
jgi:hypothetical protein